MQYSKELAIAKRAAKSAGDYLMTAFGSRNNHISYKSSHELITNADIGADKIIHKMISSAFPKDIILSEELSPFFAKATNGRPQTIASRLWIVDPLDGTNNFARNIPIFAVCIALAAPALSFPRKRESHQKQDLKIGAIYLPYSKEMFWAERGKGAHLGNKKLHVSKTFELKDLRIGIYLLKESGEIAEFKNKNKIESEDVNEAIKKLDDFKVKGDDELDNNLNEILEIIKLNDGKDSKELFDIYGKDSYKTFKRRLNELEKNNLISIKEVNFGANGRKMIINYGSLKRLNEF